MFQKAISLLVVSVFFITTLIPMPQAHAQSLLGLPEPGSMVALSAAYKPAILKGITVHPDNPFMFDFLVDIGQDKIQGEQLKSEGDKLIKYFMATLAIPEKDLWVNLSPYEKDRTVPEALAQTDMGRDLLAQDYMLKQLTASLIYPEKELGKKFWDRVYQKTQAKYGNINIPVNTFNKVWIMADKAEVFERNQTAFVTGSHLKVMLEEDYLAIQKNATGGTEAIIHARNERGTMALSAATPRGDGFREDRNNSSVAGPVHAISAQIIRDIILPELESEINTGKNFANLRQIFNSIILASWYKNNLKQSLLNEAYANKSTVKGIDIDDKTITAQIYDRYLQAYKKGVFNFVKDPSTGSGQAPRKYFSGGVNTKVNLAMVSPSQARASINSTQEFARLKVTLDPAQAVKFDAAMSEVPSLLEDYFAAIERAKGALPGLQLKANQEVLDKKIKLEKILSQLPTLKDILQALAAGDEKQAWEAAKNHFGSLSINPQDAAMQAVIDNFNILAQIRGILTAYVPNNDVIFIPNTAGQYRGLFLNTQYSPTDVEGVVKKFNEQTDEANHIRVIGQKDGLRKVTNVYLAWGNSMNDQDVLTALNAWSANEIRQTRIDVIRIKIKERDLQNVEDALQGVDGVKRVVEEGSNIALNQKDKFLNTATGEFITAEEVVNKVKHFRLLRIDLEGQNSLYVVEPRFLPKIMQYQMIKDALSVSLTVNMGTQKVKLPDGLNTLGEVQIEALGKNIGAKIILTVEDEKLKGDGAKLVSEAIAAFIAHFTVDHGKNYSANALSHEINTVKNGSKVTLFQIIIERPINENIDAAMRVDELNRLVEELNYRGVTSNVENGEHVFHLDGAFDLDFKDLVKRLNDKIGADAKQQFVFKIDAGTNDPDPRIEFNNPRNVTELVRLIQEVVAEENKSASNSAMMSDSLKVSLAELKKGDRVTVRYSYAIDVFDENSKRGKATETGTVVSVIWNKSKENGRIVVNINGDNRIFYFGNEVSQDKLESVVKAPTQVPMKADSAMKGGIDLKDAASKTLVNKEGDGVKFVVDQTMIERVRRDGIQSLTPVILRIDPSINILPLMGLAY